MAGERGATMCVCVCLPAAAAITCNPFDASPLPPVAWRQGCLSHRANEEGRGRGGRRQIERDAKVKLKEERCSSGGAGGVSTL